MANDSKNLRVLHLRSSGGFYGAEAVIVNLAKEQLRQNVDVCVGVLVRSDVEDVEHSPLALRCKEEGIPVRLFPCRGKFDKQTIQNIRERLQKDKVGILHTHDYKASLFGLFASKNLPIKRVVTNHLWTKANFKLRCYEVMEGILCNWFDQVIAVSDTIYKDVRPFLLRKNKHKLAVILNGINCANFSRQTHDTGHRTQDQEKNIFTIGMVGRLSVEKGHIYLLKAFEKLIRMTHDTRHTTQGGVKSLRLLIIGDGPLHERLVQLVHRTKILRGKVRFLPAQKDIKKFYDQMDVLVLPSLSEGLPMTLLEGMAMELPVVATRVGGVPDVIKDGFNGLLVDPAEVEQLTEAIKKIINMTHDIRHMTQGEARELKELTTNARETVELHFSTQRMAAEYLNVYKNL